MIEQSNYDILKPLGRGRMAIAYLAKNRNNSQLCVLKVFYTLGDGAKDIGLINREAQIQRRLDHPGIVRVSGVVQNIVIPNNPGSHHALVMEYVPGQDLGAYLQRKQKLSVAETLRISVQICQALDYAHSRKTIHRDIKPQNILISTDGTAKITDFGFASVMSDSINSISGLVGTPFYISPEQASGEKGDQKSDIYSVGVMMYEMLCGTVPFQGSHPSVVIDLHRTGIPKRLSERVSNIPPQLDDFVHKALEKKPNDRFHSAGEMVTVLERIAREFGVQLDTSSWKEKAANFWYKTIDVIVSNTIWWVFSAAVAFMFAVMAYRPATLKDFAQLFISIVAPPGTNEIAAQATLTISPLPTHTASVFIAGSTETPTPLPISTRKPKPTATQTSRPRATPTFTRTSKPRPTPTFTRTPRPTVTRTPTPPPHVICTSGTCLPEPGYTWVSKEDESDMRVIWKPGIIHTEFPNVVASTPEGNWRPAPGYSWVDPDNQSSFAVVRNTSTPASSVVRNDSTATSSTEGCYLFQNQYLDEVTVTFTRKSDNWNTTFILPKGAEQWQCFAPGAYTYTLGSPKGSANGEKTVKAGDNFYFPIRPSE